MTILIKQHMLNPKTWKTDILDERTTWFRDQMYAVAKVKNIVFVSNKPESWIELIKQDWEHIIVFGEHRCQAPEFIHAVQSIGKKVLLCERAPLIKNRKSCLYFDNEHLSYNGYFSNHLKWDKIMEQALLPDESSTINNYRYKMHECSQGIELQKSLFINNKQIKKILGIDKHKKLIYMPLQVDDDAVISDKKLSPWINSMQEFVDAVMCIWHDVNDKYVLIIKKHPYGHHVTIPKCNNVYYIRDEVNANSLVQSADCIISINSGSGTEALVFYKPLISLGKSFYSNKGIQWEAGSQDELHSLLKRIPELQPCTKRIDRFLYELIFNRIYDLTDTHDRIRWINHYINK